MKAPRANSRFGSNGGRWSMARGRGMTLIEVLVALAVLSLGLVALAGMQFSALQYVHSAHYRSLASTVALDFEERLWLEVADNSLSGCPDLTELAGSPIANLVTHWNRNQVGGVEVNDWIWSSAKTVKVPNLTITPGTLVAGTQVTLVPITLSWNESRFSDDESTTEQFTYNVRILCRPT